MDPSFGETYLYLGLSLRRLGHNDEALRILTKATTLDPNSPLSYRALAAAQASANQTAAALDTLQTAKKRFPLEPAFPAQMAALLKQMGRTKEAKQETTLAESLSRQGNPMHERPGSAQAGNQSDATAGGVAQSTPEHATAAQSAIISAEQLPPAAVGGAPVKGASETLGSPIVELRRCLKQQNAECANSALAAINEPAILRSSEFLALKAEALALNQQMAEALAAAIRAIEQNPAEPQYLITKGKIYDKFGDQLSAIQCYLEAAKLDPRSPEPFYCLGISFFRLDERYKAT